MTTMRLTGTSKPTDPLDMTDAELHRTYVHTVAAHKRARELASGNTLSAVAAYQRTARKLSLIRAEAVRRNLDLAKEPLPTEAFR